MAFVRYSLFGWARAGAVLGFLVPVVATAFYRIFRILAGPEVLLVWPTSMGLMGIGPNTGFLGAIEIWTICVLPNIALYSLAAMVLYVVHGFVAQWRTR